MQKDRVCIAFLSREARTSSAREQKTNHEQVVSAPIVAGYEGPAIVNFDTLFLVRHDVGNVAIVKSDISCVQKSGYNGNSLP